MERADARRPEEVGRVPESHVQTVKHQQIQEIRDAAGRHPRQVKLQVPAQIVEDLQRQGKRRVFFEKQGFPAAIKGADKVQQGVLLI